MIPSGKGSFHSREVVSHKRENELRTEGMYSPYSTGNVRILKISEYPVLRVNITALETSIEIRGYLGHKRIGN